MPTRATSKGLRLIIREEDFGPDLQSAAAVRRKGSRLLGAKDSLKEWIASALPGVVARKLNDLDLAGFELSEIEMELSVEARVFGSGSSVVAKALWKRREA